ncbi:MAG TPA: hypothetical protein VKE42_12265 [Candidatus Cybelea sp.]|nr:hypothetical protein [Candidatus Cybelea sp.]
MNDKPNYRMERIERLLTELRYEVERGMLDNEVDEDLIYQFIVPLSRKIKDGVVMCRFETRPFPRFSIVLGPAEDREPRLKVIKGGKAEPFITGSEHGPGDMG